MRWWLVIALITNSYFAIAHGFTVNAFLAGAVAWALLLDIVPKSGEENL